MNVLPDPIVCVVSDAARLVSRHAWRDEEEALLAHARQAGAAGVDLFLVREPALTGRALERIVAGIVRAAAASPMRILVSDRLDVAIAAGAHGVHLKGRSFGADRVRALVPSSFLVGRSVHEEAEAVAAAAAGGVDYLLFGTVFASGSKPAGHPVAGPDAYRRVAERVRPVPVLAIGGIDARTIDRLAGARGVAAIQWFLPDADDRGGLASTVALARRTLSGVPPG